MSDPSGLDAIRQQVTQLIAQGGAVSEVDREKAQALLLQWVEQGGDLNDATAVVMSRVYGAKPPAKQHQAQKTRIPFEYLEKFMYEALLCYGVPDDEAKLAADVLITADKRGIDSHGIGRLKPIYCDRFDAGIIKPTALLTVVKETETTAVVDGNLGLGLVIGPRCMQMAIDKAKQYGLGMVVARNSTHYGAACAAHETTSSPCPQPACRLPARGHHPLSQCVCTQATTP